MEIDAIEADSVVIPGDVILRLEPDTKKRVIIGPGLRASGTEVIVTKAGRLRKKSPNTFWVDNIQKRYIPVKGETVLGVVINKSGDSFKVDIGSSEAAELSYLAFEGATKKNRPNVNIGDIVSAKLVIANRDLEPELVCVNSHGEKELLGVLTDGFLFSCSLNLIRKILHPQCLLLDNLQRRLQTPFEIVIGMNGLIWIKSKKTEETIALANVILAAEFKTLPEMKSLCDNVANILAGF